VKVSKHCFAHLMLFLFSMPAWADTENGVSVSERPDQQVAALSVNEPIYFVVGGSSELKARFQFSFNLETSVGREKDVQDIGVNREF